MVIVFIKTLKSKLLFRYPAHILINVFLLYFLPIVTKQSFSWHKLQLSRRFFKKLELKLKVINRPIAYCHHFIRMVN